MYLVCKLQTGKVHTGKVLCAKYNWQITRGQCTLKAKYQLANAWLVKYDRQYRWRAKYYTGKLFGVQRTNDRVVWTRLLRGEDKPALLRGDRVASRGGIILTLPLAHI